MTSAPPQNGGLPKDGADTPAAPTSTRDFTLRSPAPHDGPAVHDLIAACPPLDTNSLYCNLLQCSHFADTCVVATANHETEPVGFVSGYIPPGDPFTLFVWQVAIAPAARGQGLGKRMLLELLARSACRAVTQLHTTITPDNRASWRLFASLARHLNAPLQSHPHFDRDTHFAGRHEAELLVVIGPFNATR
jgi:L-2,4-diaminobutyric acid acetyltransferase